MSKKIKVAIIFGGKSTEHEISFISAKNVLKALNPEKYDVVLLGITPEGEWYLQDPIEFKKTSSSLSQKQKVKETSQKVTICPSKEGRFLTILSDPIQYEYLDVVIPLVHGTFGEDGSIQGLLRLANIPFVGPGLLASSIGMDKDVTKRLIKAARIPTAKFLVFSAIESVHINFDHVVKKLGLPIFVKPANAGSSVGITKVSKLLEFRKAIDEAFIYDRKIIIEEAIKGREIECSVMGNEFPIISCPGEVIVNHDFYSYEAKYNDPKGAELQIPALIDPKIASKIKDLAKKAYQVLCCEGMARVDFFLTNEGKIYFNEINTIPGFTDISMYPKTWETSGFQMENLIDRLVWFALDRHQKEMSLRTQIY
ncbi:MAG: D-alanine--D-alanine ligase [Rhabdochlamydiaceae bacterium]